MELRHLRYFTAVAEELHFGRAAERLHIAQPPLSHQIRQLEQELGLALFNRTRRHVELTPAGRAFLDEVRHVFTQTERAVQTAKRADRGEIGHLSVGFVPSADLDVLPRVLRVWRARHPQVELELHALLPGEQLEALRQGRIQVGFLRLPVDDPALVVEPIQREPLVAVLPNGHRLASRRRIRLADLAGDPMILFPRRISPGYYDVFIAACRRAGFLPRVSHEAVHIQTNLGLVSAGLGVTLMPRSVQSLARTGVVYRSLVPPAPVVEMAAVYARRDRSAVLPAFLSVVHHVVGRRRARRGAGARAIR